VEDSISRLPKQLVEGARLGEARAITNTYRNIICCGMGGSSIAGEILSMLRDTVIVHWDYDLPENAGSQDLVICTSWSGDTEETLSSYETARAKGIDTLCVTSGGTLAQRCESQGTPLVLLPHTDPVPRANVGLMAGALLGAMGLGNQLPTNLDSNDGDAQGRALAEIIGNRMLVVYSSHPWRKLTGFWKMAYSETAKRQVMPNWFPSGAHTEIVGWEGPYQDAVSFLFLRDPEEKERYVKNFDALLALLPKKGYTVHTIELSGTTLLEKVFRGYLLALWTGYHTAQRLGVNPLATALLDEFKQLKTHV
jgi:glucose/mannose-6-phosphate isomerase